MRGAGELGGAYTRWMAVSLGYGLISTLLVRFGARRKTLHHKTLQHNVARRSPTQPEWIVYAETKTAVFSGRGFALKRAGRDAIPRDR